jgi:hypothetical protein
MKMSSVSSVEISAAEAHNAYLNNAEDYNKAKIFKRDYITKSKSFKNQNSQSA